MTEYRCKDCWQIMVLANKFDNEEIYHCKTCPTELLIKYKDIRNDNGEIIGWEFSSGAWIVFKPNVCENCQTMFWALRPMKFCRKCGSGRVPDMDEVYKGIKLTENNFDVQLMGGFSLVREAGDI
jgi:rRNA maturation endonuclease Nob1